MYYLCKLREVCSEVCIVVNGNLAESDERKLYGVSDRLIKLDEDGFDAWAFKKAIEKYGFDTIAECYDELVLSDSTNFGPIYPFKEMFSEMGKRDCDFWGSYRYNNIIGTDFIVFRKAILISNDFRNYWSKMKFPFSHSQAVKHHAARYSVFFESRGYISDEYTPWEKYRQYQYPVMRFAYRQATEDRNPLIKRNVFYNIDDCFQFPQCDVYSAYDLVNYIREKTDYPINLIADNMERIMAFPQDVQCPENESDRLAGNMCTDINKRCQYYINANKRFDPEKLYHSHK